MQVLVTSVTFIIFMIEALFHFNIGRNGDLAKYGFKLPDSKEFLYIVTIVGLFSVLNGFVINCLQNSKFT